LETIRSGGRLAEVALMRKYKLRTFHLFEDVHLVPRMLLSGKLKLFPRKIKGADAVARIFERCIKGQAGSSEG
jgi:heterodisulfide reductase subunit C